MPQCFPRSVNRFKDARWLKGMKWFSLFRPEDADIWPIWLFDLWPQLPAEQTGGFPLRSLGLMSFPSARFKISLINTAHRSVTTGIKVTDGGDRGGGRGGGGGISAFSFDSPPTFTFEIAPQCVINNQSKDKWMWSSELLPVGRHIWAVWGFADNRLPWLWFSPAVCTQMMKKQQQLAVNQTVQRWQQACGVGHK